MSVLHHVKNELRHIRNSSPWLLLLWNEMLRARGKRELRRYSDVEAVKRLYYARSGRYPNLDAPTLFSEKQQWMKFYYRDPLMARCADKYDVRGYVAEKGHADILNELLGVYERVEEIPFDALPTRFVLKATHGSGWNVICQDKDKMNWRVWKLIMKSWLRHNIFWNGREWVYRDVTPRIVCEKYLQDRSGHLVDYKFYCFNGQPAFVQANMGRGEKGHAQNFYDLDWSLLPFGKDLAPRPEVQIPKPRSFDRMLAIAGDLAAPFSFVRADFYDVGGKPVFGELTFFPASGMPDFVPAEHDAIVGDMWTLPEKNN
jgi:hypothetical protein